MLKVPAVTGLISTYILTVRRGVVSVAGQYVLPVTAMVLVLGVLVTDAVKVVLILLSLRRVIAPVVPAQFASTLSCSTA
jgi:hypothetical protein